jgi:selenocysteine-specific elongation factor
MAWVCFACPCPGAGAQIIDMMILVVDVTKGIQTQTAECLVVGEILTQQLIVVLNKTDMLPADSRADKVREES